ncbi:MAG: sterol desaturase family protein [Acidobacteriota bacterium]
MLRARFVSFWFYPTVGPLVLYSAGRLDSAHQWRELFWLVPAGLLFWTALEYGLHRFVFHLRPRSKVAARILASLHLRHHGDPRNRERILVRLPYSVSMSIFLLVVLTPVLGSLFRSAGLLAGIWAGFLYYELVHYRVHLSKSNGGLLAYQRRSHFHHHYVDEGYCFGVTSPLWDRVLGTYKRTE